MKIHSIYSFMVFFIMTFALSMTIGCAQESISPLAGDKGKNQQEFSAEKLHQNLSEYPLGLISLEEKNGLLLMREEEKLAHDVYLKFEEKYGRNIFRNIGAAESRHMQAVLVLLDRYDIADPVSPAEVGVLKIKIYKNCMMNL